MTQIKSNISEYVDECYDYGDYGDSDYHDNHDDHDDHDQGKARQRRGFLRVLSEQRTPYVGSLLGQLLMMHRHCDDDDDNGAGDDGDDYNHDDFDVMIFNMIKS